MTKSQSALLFSGVLTLIFLFSQTFVPASAVTYSITLQTNAPSYSGLQPIVITGVISPAPGANTAVIITIKNPAGTVADIDEAIPSSTTGSFNYTSYPGGSSAWTSGTFSVNATWGGNGATASMVTTFSYSSTTTATTTTTTVSTTPTTTTSTAPEFPSSAVALVALLAVGLVAVLSRRTMPGAPSSPSR